MKISVIIPTFQAGKKLPALLDNLEKQTMRDFEIIIVDSSSTDDTISVAERAGCTVKIIERENFRHGRARNMGAFLAGGDIFVFLTQDVFPANKYFLENLTETLRKGKASAACARQIACPSASPLEVFARKFNYPPQSKIKTIRDVAHMGIKAYFFSNSASAVLRDAFYDAEGFCEDLIVNEDMYLCALLLNKGYSAAYEAKAVVYHSHDYKLLNLFRRYFDIGVFFSQAEPLLGGAKTGGEGFRFVTSLLKYLVEKKEFFLIPRVFIESVFKYTAFKSGNNHKYLPLFLKKLLSGHPYFWRKRP